MSCFHTRGNRPQAVRFTSRFVALRPALLALIDHACAATSTTCRLRARLRRRVLASRPTAQQYLVAASRSICGFVNRDEVVKLGPDGVQCPPT
ncbi:hypothetical protein DOTSEDRAFT_39998 [Dothistroma septosporum NZE10]|uniref:Uncharacterized protein n=1 Tax=Dothistroma septosporum (strain NZE10 / CBS 128990) TaxID=675120 RepID=N1Q2K9_DOTSN|nr:hypothetical protein DOTSEDRAFT_39998 [Dothistroma septosporum NZE10]